jgi:peptidyl-prolyl cis-trans isomerase C
MRILLPAALAALLLAMPHRAPAQTPPAASPQPADTAADPVIAIVDGTAIRRSEMLAMQRQLPAQYQQMPIEMIFPVLLERMIDSKLIAVAGRQVGLQNEPEVKARVASFEERVVQEVYLTRRIAQRADDATLRKRYDEFVKANPPKEEIHARHILVATESEANTVSDALRKGADFQKLAGEKTIDPSGKTTGGDLGFFGKDEMVPEFSAAAFALKDGEVSAKPVKTQFGWHVIMVVERRTIAPSFEEMREQLTSELSQEIVNDEIQRLRKDAKVERFNPDGSPRKAP